MRLSCPTSRSGNKGKPPARPWPSGTGPTRRSERPTCECTGGGSRRPNGRPATRSHGPPTCESTGGGSSTKLAGRSGPRTCGSTADGSGRHPADHASEAVERRVARKTWVSPKAGVAAVGRPSTAGLESGPGPDRRSSGSGGSNVPRLPAISSLPLVGHSASASFLHRRRGVRESECPQGPGIPPADGVSSGLDGMVGL